MARMMNPKSAWKPRTTTTQRGVCWMYWSPLAGAGAGAPYTGCGAATGAPYTGWAVLTSSIAESVEVNLTYLFEKIFGYLWMPRTAWQRRGQARPLKGKRSEHKGDPCHRKLQSPIISRH